MYYVWDGTELAAAIAGDTLARYVDYPGATDRPHSVTVSWPGRAAATYYYVQDNAPGNVMGLVAAGGALAAGYAYDAWGQVTAAGEAGLGGWSNPRRFAGREWDPETGLYYNRARYYDPGLRRFVSRDPIGLAGGVNWYAYAGGDPVNGRDPSGRDACFTIIYWTTNWDGSDYREESREDTCFGGDGGDGSGDGSTDGQPKKPPKPRPCAGLEDGFVSDHRGEAAQIAATLNVPTSYVLGLSAIESDWGQSRISGDGIRNYFSLHLNGPNDWQYAPFQTGITTAQNNSNVYIAKFPSYLASGQAFAASRFGRAVRGASSPNAFITGLMVSGYNTGDPATGGTRGFGPNTISRIRNVERRMSCQ